MPARRARPNMAKNRSKLRTAYQRSQSTRSRSMATSRRKTGRKTAKRRHY